MIPFRDNIPSRTFPIVTVALIVVNAAVFFQELLLGRHLTSFIQVYGLVPLRWIDSVFSLDPAALPNLVTLLTAMFLHGGWLHLIGNMWYLWIFGDNVEDYLGHIPYLGFYLICGVLGNLAHIFFNWSSTVPSIGASGAIAGVLGAYLLLFPGARVLTLIPLLIFWPIIELPAVILLGFWFVEQFFSGFSSFAMSPQAGGGVAWFAHIGGFIAGMVLIARTRRTRRRRSYSGD
ncbi:MAG: rhomboid family intramembrane serine protease [Acidobacteriia bacterium]|nr:rhomboid family intramembrane serine protease [Terriglobia bacterium]